MNVIALTGNLCKELKIYYTKNNKAYLENTIAVKKDKKDANGNYEADFINFVAFEKKAEYLSNYAKTGDKIEITGKLRTDKWTDANGVNKIRTYVVADTIKILTSRIKQQEAEPTIIEGKTPIITDDDLPF